VSYTLIDPKTNQPTMIMEPLEFEAYRNATPGMQAMDAAGAAVCAGLCVGGIACIGWRQ
jgi:hypothetical protein